MIRLLLDQGLPRSAAESLRAAGWETSHVGELGMARSPDADILQLARRDSWVVVTLDADFHTLVAVSGEALPSVIRVRLEGLKGAELSGLLQKVLARVADDLLRGALVTVTEKSIRLRHLPVIAH